MNNRERFLAIMNYQDYDRMPVMHFGYWKETLQKWAAEGHISQKMADNRNDCNKLDLELNKMLGFDFGFGPLAGAHGLLNPPFERKVIAEFPDGSRHVRDSCGVTLLQMPDAGSIPSEIEHLLTDRASWEKHYKWRVNWDEKQAAESLVPVNGEYKKLSQGGLEFLRDDRRESCLGVNCGSGIGQIRSIIGVIGMSYMQMDDEALLDEIIDSCNGVAYQGVKYLLEQGAIFDFGHFWEDICFNGGPLVTPDFFKRKIVPWYKKFSALLSKHGVDLISVDCDGKIDELAPLWLEGGVNIMFPIEVGTWRASIEPWRKKYGRQLRGIGGMNKTVFAKDKAAIDQEVERLKPLVELGGFIPCPDHRIAPDAKWDLVKYYTEKMRAAFS